MAETKILMTGASSALGLATLNKLNSPCRVICLSRNKPEQFSNPLVTMVHKHCDLGLQSSIDTVLNDMEENFDHVILLAGISNTFKRFNEISREEMHEVFQVNLFSNISILNKIADHVTGSITVISTNSIKYHGSENNTYYISSKSALETYCLSLGKVLAYAGGARLNIIRVGLIGTNMKYKIQGYTDEHFEKRKTLVPGGKAGEPDDLASLLAFLMSPNANFINLQTICLTGGE